MEIFNSLTWPGAIALSIVSLSAAAVLIVLIRAWLQE